MAERREAKNVHSFNHHQSFFKFLSPRSGKTTLLNVLSMGHAIETLPTVGLNVKIMKKEGVSMKVCRHKNMIKKLN